MKALAKPEAEYSGQPNRKNDPPNQPGTKHAPRAQPPPEVPRPTITKSDLAKSKEFQACGRFVRAWGKDGKEERKEKKDEETGAAGASPCTQSLCGEGEGNGSPLLFPCRSAGRKISGQKGVRRRDWQQHACARVFRARFAWMEKSSFDEDGFAVLSV